jgi:hypothetical protein
MAAALVLIRLRPVLLWGARRYERSVRNLRLQQALQRHGTSSASERLHFLFAVVHGLSLATVSRMPYPSPSRSRPAHGNSIVRLLRYKRLEGNWLWITLGPQVACFEESYGCVDHALVEHQQ